MPFEGSLSAQWCGFPRASQLPRLIKRQECKMAPNNRPIDKRNPWIPPSASGIIQICKRTVFANVSPPVVKRGKEPVEVSLIQVARRSMIKFLVLRFEIAAMNISQSLLVYVCLESSGRPYFSVFFWYHESCISRTLSGNNPRESKSSAYALYRDPNYQLKNKWY